MPELDRTYEDFISIQGLRYYVLADSPERWAPEHRAAVLEFLEPIKDWLMRQWNQDVDNDSEPTEGFSSQNLLEDTKLRIKSLLIESRTVVRHHNAEITRLTEERNEAIKIKKTMEGAAYELGMREATEADSE